MKKILMTVFFMAILLTGCSGEKEPAVTVTPLPDTVMENLTDAVLSVSLKEGDAYVDDTGIMRMDLKIYTYNKYDIVDISALKVGDILVTHSGEVEVASLECSETGKISIQLRQCFCQRAGDFHRKNRVQITPGHTGAIGGLYATRASTGNTL